MKFLQHWPFLGRLRICFVEPPYFQMTIKPVFSYGLDVSELPGISGWLVSFSFRLRLLDIFFYILQCLHCYFSLLRAFIFLVMQDKLLDIAFGQTLVEVSSLIFICFLLEYWMFTANQAPGFQK